MAVRQMRQSDSTAVFRIDRSRDPVHNAVMEHPGAKYIDSMMTIACTVLAAFAATQHLN